MDYKGLRDKEFKIDLEIGSEEDSSDSSVQSVKKQAKTLLSKVYGGFSDASVNAEESIGFCGNGFHSNGVCPENLKLATNKMPEGNGGMNHEEKSRPKEERKKTSNKKPPKPPRPPRGPSLDAADQKLIKELSDIAIWKRARVERMKALKKMKAAKASSSNSNIYALVFTLLFCAVLIFQGISSSRSSTAGFEGSPLSAGRSEGSLISIQFYPDPSSNALNGPGSESPNMVEQVSGSDQQEKLKRWARGYTNFVA